MMARYVFILVSFGFHSRCAARIIEGSDKLTIAAESAV